MTYDEHKKRYQSWRRFLAICTSDYAEELARTEIARLEEMFPSFKSKPFN